MATLNSVNLIAYLGQDPIVRQTHSGQRPDMSFCPLYAGRGF